MSIFGKPVSQITSADLEELVSGQAVENVRLEFKREVPRRDETLKKLSSFANTYGGFLIVGAEAASKDGRIQALVGVEPQPNYKQTLVQWCADGVSPVVQVDVSDPIPVPGGEGKVCYVVVVPESDLTPHFLNERKGLWVRTNEFSSRFEPQLANEAELRHLSERRNIVRQRRAELIRRARDRFRTFTDRRYKELEDGRTSIGTRFNLSIIPRFPAENICSHARLRSTMHGFKLNWRQVGFPRDSVGFVTQHESEIVLYPASGFSIFEANTWGLLFYATEIEDAGETYSGIHVNRFLGQLLVFLKHAREMIARLGYGGPLLVEMQLEGIRGVQWIYFGASQRAKQGPSSELDDEVSFSILTTAEDLHARLDGVVRDLLRFVFFATNWATIAENDEKLADMLKNGYEFNMWERPDELAL